MVRENPKELLIYPAMDALCLKKLPNLTIRFHWYKIHTLQGLVLNLHLVIIKKFRTNWQLITYNPLHRPQCHQYTQNRYDLMHSLIPYSLIFGKSPQHW